jgi:hypothetical protein
VHRLTASLWLLLGSYAFASNPPSVLNDSNHVVSDLTADLTVLGIAYSGTLGPSSTVLAVNQTCPGACTIYTSTLGMIEDATNLAQTEFAADSTTTVTPLVPYQVINESFASYTLAGDDQTYYSTLEADKIVYSIAYCGIPSVGDYPAVAFVTVLPNNSVANFPGTSEKAVCGYAQGVEFSIPVTNGLWTPISGGGSVVVSSASATTEAMSAVLVALKSNHPNWTWGDIKSVLRTTASNWSTGYTTYNSNGPSYGYGNINYPSANSYTGTIYLQPPGMAIQGSNTNPVLTLYPFMTTRRSGEVIYAFSSPPVFPSPGSMNEYTYTEISALVNTYRGSLLYSSNGASGVQTYTYRLPSVKKPVYFVAFTVDNISQLTTANYSRAEIYSTQRAFYASAAVSVINRTLLLR